MLWCYSDYDPALWERPPLDLARHERTFGLWRVDGSPKPAVAAVAAFVGAERCTIAQTEPWIDIERDEYWLDPSGQLARLYRRYLGAVRHHKARGVEPQANGLLCRVSGLRPGAVR
jgi:hypothetical protein